MRTLPIAAAVAALAFAGAANAHPKLHGQLLLAKLALFIAMLGLASLNRFQLTPAFERSLAAGDHRGALGTLRASLAVETACAILVLGLVAWLGTLEPPTSSM